MEDKRRLAMIKNRSERGQALVLIVLGVVVLLGFTALAIDGGSLYADRRFAQNGADTASWAGGGAAAGYLKLASEDPALAAGVSGEDWNCSATSVISATLRAHDQAILFAGRNEFMITSSPDFNATGNIVATHCEQVSGRYIDVRVSVTLDSRPSLLHFVFSGPARNTVDAITRVFPREPVGGGYSFVSLTDTCSGSEKGTRISGTSDIIMNGGGIFSNSCIVSDGSSGTVTIITGTASYDNGFTYDPHGAPIINPSPQPVNYEFKPSVPPPDCIGNLNPAPVTSGSDTTYSPGRYTNDININGGGPITPTVTLQPGLYCFDNGADLSITGSNITGTNVTLFFTDDGGGMDTTGKGTVQIYPPTVPCPVPPFQSDSNCNPSAPNLLIYVAPGNTNPIKLGGNSTSYYEGTVYAPSSQVSLGGTTSELSTVGVQVIAESIRVHGTVTMTITYDSSKLYHTPNFMNLQK